MMNRKTMGVECYTVALKPSPGAGLTVAEVEETLDRLGFRLEPLMSRYGPAKLPAPPRDQREYLQETPRAVVEALVRWTAAAPEMPTRTDRLHVTEIEIRFAVGQPPAAEEQFFQAVCQLVAAHTLSLREETQCGLFSPDAVDAFERLARPRIAALRQNWRRLVGDGEEPMPLRPADAWAYYLRRHGT